jgi:hypothetical protein
MEMVMEILNWMIVGATIVLIPSSMIVGIMRVIQWRKDRG